MPVKCPSVNELRKLLPSICDCETSLDPKNWTASNPLWGHCAVVSLVAQNLFSGELARASLKEITGFEAMGSHYWNRLPDGREEDFTKEQFGGNYPAGLKAETRQRDYVLSYEATKKRYKLLVFRLARILSTNNPLFDDETYRSCFESALDSPCQKKKFGCVIKYHPTGEVVYRGCNDTIKPLKSMCQPQCVRLNIQSRTESLLGACGHAEELGIWNLVKRGIRPEDCEIYVAGLDDKCLPLIKKQPEFTCLRCAIQMYHAGIKMVYSPVVDKWMGQTAEGAIETARAYATREKNIKQLTE